MASITEHEFDGHGGYAHGCAACRIEELEAALSALRARETGLREALGDCLRVLNLPGCDRLTHSRECIDYDPAGSTYEVTPHEWFTKANAAFSTPAVHGASEATGDTK